MIKTKADLKYYLAEDLKRIGWAMPWWKAFIFSETYRVHSYIRNLRYLEYYTNNRKWYNLPMYIYHLLQHRRMSLRNVMNISPNVMGPGFKFVHPGFLRINPGAHIGKNCTILPNVLIGRKLPGIRRTPDGGMEDVDRGLDPFYIGDNCYIGTGAILLIPHSIGNNVTIAAGSVVLDDVPDNCVVAGVPAKIIKRL